MQKLAVYFSAALAISLALTPICRAVAKRRGFVARPTQDRWHTRPTALFGGVAVALTVLTLA
jgi:UDP-GlcNAc:undecaprenyl-phosphate GlcNAc-1-phosphate transferase